MLQKQAAHAHPVLHSMHVTVQVLILLSQCHCVSPCRASWRPQLKPKQQWRRLKPPPLLPWLLLQLPTCDSPSQRARQQQQPAASTAAGLHHLLHIKQQGSQQWPQRQGHQAVAAVLLLMQPLNTHTSVRVRLQQTPRCCLVLGPQGQQPQPWLLLLLLPHLLACQLSPLWSWRCWANRSL